MDWTWGANSWPPRSPDLSPLDFFVWGFLEQEVYKICLQDLSSRLDAAIIKLRNDVSLRATIVSMHKLARACIGVEAANFNNSYKFQITYQMVSMHFHYTSRCDICIVNSFAYSFLKDIGNIILILFLLLHFKI